MKKNDFAIFGLLAVLLVAVNFLYNGYLLTVSYAFTYSLFHFGNDRGMVHYSNEFWAVLGFGTVLILMALGLLNSVQFLTKLLLGVRDPLIAEEQKIRKLLDEVLANTTTKINKITILVSDKTMANAEAFGQNSIIVTSGLLNTATDGELKAILAHELSHLYHKDSLIPLALVLANIPMRCIMWLYQFYAAMSLRVRKAFSSEGNLFSLLAIIPIVLFSPIIILDWLGRWLIQACLFIITRSFEYRADQFAVDLGFKIELISFLSKQAVIHKKDSSFLAMIFASHPSPIKRIAKLEKTINPSK